MSEPQMFLELGIDAQGAIRLNITVPINDHENKTFTAVLPSHQIKNALRGAATEDIRELRQAVADLRGVVATLRDRVTVLQQENEQRIFGQINNQSSINEVLCKIIDIESEMKALAAFHKPAAERDAELAELIAAPNDDGTW